MYPIIRLITTLSRSFLSKKVSVDSISEISFRCRPWDIDMFMEMNNGRILTLYDLGRFDLVLRSGIGPAFKKNKWGLVVAGSTIQYRKRIRVFDKVTIRTHIAGFEDRWIYIVQSMWVKNQACSSVLLRTGITAKGKVVMIDEVAKELKIKPWSTHNNADDGAWLDQWISSEEKRPWPPS